MSLRLSQHYGRYLDCTQRSLCATLTALAIAAEAVAADIAVTTATTSDITAATRISYALLLSIAKHRKANQCTQIETSNASHCAIATLTFAVQNKMARKPCSRWTRAMLAIALVLQNFFFQQALSTQLYVALTILHSEHYCNFAFHYQIFTTNFELTQVQSVKTNCRLTCWRNY